MRLLVVQAVALLAILGSARAEKTSTYGSCSKQEEGLTYGIAGDCQKYLLCKKGVLEIKDCKKKYYDTVTGKCVQADRAICAVETAPEPEPLPEPIPEPEPEQEEDAEQYDYLCYKVLYGVRVHPTACDRYLVCNKEKATIERCEDGLIFIADFISCSPGSKVTCTAEPDEPTTQSTVVEPEPTFPTTEESGSEEDSSESSGTYDYLCAKTLVGSVAHPETCNKYISCYKNKAKEQSCKKGYAYTSKLHLCIKQKNGACPDDVQEESTTQSTVVEPEPTFPTTEESGSEEDSSESSGTYDYLCAKTLVGSVAHPETCNKYISCYKYKAKEQSCKKGYAYTSKLHLCIKQKKGACPDDVQEESTTQSTVVEPEPTFPTTEESGSEEDSSESSGTYDYLCAKTLVGSVAHPETCNKYISCYKYKAKEQNCKKGYAYTSKLHLCIKQKNGACPDDVQEASTTQSTVVEPEPTFPTTEESGSEEDSSESSGTYDYLCAKTLVGSVAHPETCNKYISCYKYKAKEQSCKKGYAYTSKLHLCIKQKNGACPDDVQEESTTQSTVVEPEPTFPTTEESGSEEDSSESSGTYDYLCAKTLVGSVAHPETCNKYISCYKYKAKEQNCKKGYAYTSKLHLCIKQKNGTCPDDVQEESTTQSTVVEPEPTFPTTEESGSEEDSSEGSGTYDYLCAKTLVGSVAHPETCNKYISCYKYKAKEQSCKKGYAYTSKLHLCIKQKNGACPDDVQEESTTQSTVVEPEPTFPTTEESGSEEDSSESSGTYDYLCAKTLVGSVAHPETCNKYISCYKYKAKEQSCKKGYAYTSKLHLCIKQKNGACPDDVQEESTTQSTVVEPEPTFPTTEESGSEEDSSESSGTYDYLCAKTLVGSVAHPETCNKYISCYKNKAKEQSCKKGYAYTSKLHLCIKQKNGACPDDVQEESTTQSTVVEPEPTFPTTEESGSEEDSSESSGTYDYLCAKTLVGSVAHPETCNKYISCYNYKAKEQSCKKGYAYTSKLHLCIKQKNGACPDDVQEESTTQSTVVEPEPTFPTTEESGSEEDSSESSGTYDYLCVNAIQGSLPHPDSCTKYIVCSNSKAKEESCKNGYYFSVYLKSCIKGNSETCAEINGNDGTSSQAPPATTEAVPPAVGGDPGDGNAGCIEGFTGYLPIANDCTSYVYCFQGEPGVRKCLEDYIYYDPFKACLPGDTVLCKLYTI
uniref:Chitin-binding type-2 domain-containing protein n=1 Tax=Anopheles coluzzii TaxID=1518534 RepID=A0A6E8W4G5_ANOCL